MRKTTRLLITGALVASVASVPIYAVATTTPPATSIAGTADSPLNAWGGPVANPAIFMFAHQDDETLTFGAEIEHHKAAGRYIIGVLATDGRASAARTAMNLSVEAFVKARNLELVHAAKDLGMDELHLSGAHDGQFTQAQADALALYWVRLYPKGSFKVPSERDDHPDHRVIGIAFQKLKKSMPTLDVRFYVKPEQRTQFAGLIAQHGGTHTITAAHDYMTKDPANGLYGIGYASVPADFRSIVANPVSYYYR